MKKYIIAMLSVATITLAGCGMSQEHMMMMEEMKTQMNEIQFQVNSNAASAARAKDMAEEAIIKASMQQGHHGSMNDRRNMMHHKRMMK